MSVVTFNALAANVVASVLKGQPVVVHGRLRINSQATTEGRSMISVEVDAHTVGHDLTKGQSLFSKPVRAQFDPTDRMGAPSAGVPGRTGDARLRGLRGRAARAHRGDGCPAGAGRRGRGPLRPRDGRPRDRRIPRQSRLTSRDDRGVPPAQGTPRFHAGTGRVPGSGEGGRFGRHTLLRIAFGAWPSSSTP
ncbi:MAG: single-stranded DNA-binding protein [Actinomycetales bacterium]|nr:single-stranded DNA-binding protein [Actinomycetales bacterium]